MHFGKLSVTFFLLYSTMAQAASVGLSKAIEPDTFQKVLWGSIETAATKSSIQSSSAVAKGDMKLQLQQLDALYAAGMDGIIASMTSPKVGSAMAENARKLHKPLVFVNTQPSPDLLGSGVAFVGSDEGEAGTIQMMEVCRQLKGKGSITILMGELSHPATKKRTTAIHEILKSPACNGIELQEEQSANWSRAQAHEIVRAWLRAGVKPDAILANNDDMALGAVDGLKEGAVKGIVVAGIDATDGALSAMQAGDLAITVLQDAHQQGDAAVALMKSMMAGEAVPPMTMVPFKLVTPDRVAQFVRHPSGG